jgi:acyl-CoA hydrolase
VGNVSETPLNYRSFLRAGDTVIWGQASAEPVTLTRALVEQRHELPRVRLMLGIDLTQTIRPEHADAFDFAGYCGAGGNRQLAMAGLLDLYPLPYSQLAREIQHGHCKADVVLVQVSAPNTHGLYSLGLTNDWLIPALRSARVVIAEVNAEVPWTHGSMSLSEADIDLKVTALYPPLEYTSKAPTETEGKIAANVANLIEDGATLQVGLGGVASRVFSLLRDRRDLGFHSGLAIDALVDLAESGALTNARKTIDPGQTVAGILMGSRRLYDFAHQNAALQMRGSDYTHDAKVLNAIERFVAINSAIEVDLTGQVNAEVAAGNYVGAVGGAPDFLRAAHSSLGGLPIIALPSTEKSMSRIVAGLTGPVSTPRCDAGVIVTEYGVADLRGLPVRSRMKKMIEIAAPEHREALELQSHQMLKRLS